MYICSKQIKIDFFAILFSIILRNYVVHNYCLYASIDQYSNYTDQVADKEMRVNGINTQGNLPSSIDYKLHYRHILYINLIFF